MNQIKTLVSSLNINTINETKILQILPELKELKNFKEINVWHRGENVFEHTIEVVNNLLILLDWDFINNSLRLRINSHIISKSTLTRRDLLLFATLLHDIGKLTTFTEDRNGFTSFPNHESAGVITAKNILDRFKITEEERSFVLKLIKNHSVFNYLSSYLLNTIKKEKEGKTKQLILSFNEDAFEIFLLNFADFLTSATKKNNLDLYKFQKEYFEELVSYFNLMNFINEV